MKYYKHKDLDTYVMISPTRVIKIYGDSFVQYTQKDYFFSIESDIDTSKFKPIPEHEFRFAFIQLLETLAYTLKTITNEQLAQHADPMQ
jgi:hypothetical protein